MIVFLSMFDKDVFNTLLLFKTWDTYFDNNDPDELWEFMLTNITDILAVMCPLKFKNVFVSKPEWLTDELLSLMEQRNHYVCLAKERGAIVYHKKARFLRNKCNRLVNTAKGDFIRGKLHENKKNPKRFWRQINSLLSTDNVSNVYHQIVDPNTGELCVPNLESEIINTYYATVGSNILENHVGTETWDFGTQRVNHDVGIDFDEITEGEVDIQSLILRLVNRAVSNKSTLMFLKLPLS